jgi:hypothetical protein
MRHEIKKRKNCDKIAMYHATIINHVCVVLKLQLHNMQFDVLFDRNADIECIC